MQRFVRPLAVIALGGLVLVACGDKGTEPALSGDVRETEESTTSTEATTTVSEGEQIEVRGIDYGFEGIPNDVAAGTSLRFVNASDTEPHELVLFLLPDTETRSLLELLQLPPEELEPILGEPVGVNVAPQPGEEGEMALGTLTLTEPGRYAALCFLPVGVDPERVASSQGPLTPEPGDGPPHFTRGMADEFVVS